NAALDRYADDSSPGVLRRADGVAEVRHEQQVLDAALGRVRLGDPIQEPGTDDAAAAPDPGDRSQLQVPTILVGGRLHFLESLRVGDDFRGIKGAANVIDQGRRRRLASTVRTDQRAGRDLAIRL